MSVTRARIAIDAMGGDYAPTEAVLGAIKASKELDVDIVLVGDPAKIRASVKQPLPETIRIVTAADAIAMDEDPISAVRRKPQASINVAIKLVKDGEVDAMVSAGHSGAVMAAATLRLGRIPGVERPGIGALFPTVIPGKRVLILDVGANVDCRPSFLEQFAVVGSAYSECMLGVYKPRVGLLNIGEEPTKGNDLALRVHDLLQVNPHIEFAGNAEGRDVLSGDFDVIICDGFVGNVLLKFAEAVGESIIGILKEELPRGIRGKIGAMILKPNLRRVKQRIDHAEHGGGLLLGVNGVCIISHGSSKAPSIFTAIRLAQEAAEHNVIDRLHEQYDQVRAAAAEAQAAESQAAESQA